MPPRTRASSACKRRPVDHALRRTTLEVRHAPEVTSIVRQPRHCNGHGRTGHGHGRVLGVEEGFLVVRTLFIDVQLLLSRSSLALQRLSSNANIY